MGVYQGREDTFTCADKANSLRAQLVRKANHSVQIVAKGGYVPFAVRCAMASQIERQQAVASFQQRQHKWLPAVEILACLVKQYDPGVASGPVLPAQQDVIRCGQLNWFSPHGVSSCFIGS